MTIYERPFRVLYFVNGDLQASLYSAGGFYDLILNKLNPFEAESWQLIEEANDQANALTREDWEKVRQGRKELKDIVKNP